MNIRLALSDPAPVAASRPGADLTACAAGRCLARWFGWWVLMVAIGSGAPGATLPRGVASHAISTWLMGQGLPHDTITAVVQTADDYLWIGTEGGLARFDGVRFTTYRTTNTPALSSHSIRALAVDRRGTLWIGTESGVVSHRDGRFEFAGLAHRSIHALCEDAQGGLWVATELGVIVKRGAIFETPADPRLARAIPTTLFADQQGQVWIGLAGEAAVLRVANGALERVTAADAFDAEVLAIAQTPDGALWFGGESGLVQWHNGRARHFDIEDGLAGRRVSRLHVDAAGVLWLATEGLQRINGGEIATIAEVAPNRAARVQALAHDREGNIWAGSVAEGLMRIRQPAWQLINLGARGTGSGFRTVMQGPDGTVWLAQGARGIVRIGAEGEVARVLPQGGSDAGEVVAVYATEAGDVLVGTRTALEVWRDGRCDVYPDLPEARTIFTSRDGTVWLGLKAGGVVTWRDGAFTRMPLPSEAMGCTPSSFTETAAGEILAGTWSHGLLRITPDGDVSVWNRQAGAPTNDLRLVYVDRGGATWIGSPGLGLSLLKGDRLLVADWTSELIDQRIDSLLEDDRGNLWISSGRGVFMAPREDLFGAMNGRIAPHRLRLAYLTEGFRGAVEDLSCFPNVGRTRTGQLWYATRNGILICDPTKTAPNHRAPTVHIERVMAGGHRWESPGELTLPAGANGLLIEYSGLSFTAPHRVRFQYRLHGIDTEWIEAGERRAASYASVPPGRYEFQVIAANADGVWNDEGARLWVEQEAHFYERPWVYAIASGMLGTAIFGFTRWRVVRLRRDKRRLELAIGERTRELQVAKELAEASTRAKSEFLQNISHEIRNPLNGVLGLVSLLREAHLDARQNEVLVSLRACSKALGRVFDEVLRFTRLEHGQVSVRETPFSLRTLVDETVALFRAAEPGRSCDLVIECEPDRTDRFVGDEEKIQTILGNFIGNAMRHAPDARIEISTTVDAVSDFGASVTLVVADHGPGIPLGEQELIFEKFVRGARAQRERTAGSGLGLATCRALADLLGGHVGVESEPGHGASFFLTLRLKRDRTPIRAVSDPIRVSDRRNRALVIEDQTYNQVVAQRILEQLGFVADVASDAQGALARLAEQRYDLVLADWELPDRTGEELATLIRNRPTARDVILVATTGHDGDDIRRRGLVAGFDGFSRKPLDADALARELAAARRRRNGVAGATTVLDTRVFRLVGRSRAAGVRQAADQYARILDQQLGVLDAGIRSGDRTVIARTAHCLKTHAGLVHATQLREVADRLERGARQLPFVELRALQQELVASAAVVQEQLNQSSHSGAAV